MYRGRCWGRLLLGRNIPAVLNTVAAGAGPLQMCSPPLQNEIRSTPVQTDLGGVIRRIEVDLAFFLDADIQYTEAYNIGQANYLNICIYRYEGPWVASSRRADAKMRTE